MKYKIYLDAIKCNRWYCNFIKSCGLGIDEYGTPCVISFIMEEQPTEEIINKIIDIHLQTKDNKKLECYFSNVKFKKIEVLLNETNET